MPNSEPQGWVTTTLEVVADWASGGTPSRSNVAFFNGDIPWIKTGELGSKFIREAEEKITPEAIEHSAAKIFPKGSVGIAMYGATIGKLSIWGISASTNQACAVATVVPDLLFNEFLFYYLLSQRRGFVEAGKGGAQPNISQGVLKEWPVCLPPFNEQRRIVGKIEELFSELDKGMENLRLARAQLAVYRQALLKHAFAGRLTAAWRETHTAQLESADQLLARIHAERAKAFELEMEQWNDAVAKWDNSEDREKSPPKPQKLKPAHRGQRPLTPAVTPESWPVFHLDEIVISIGQGWSPKCEGFPAENGNWGVIKTTAIQRLEFRGYENKQLPDGMYPRPWLQILQDDILITRAGPRSRCGIVCRVKDRPEKLMLCDKAYGLRLPQSVVSSGFMELLLNSTEASNRIEGLKTGINDSGVNITQSGFLNLAFPIPPISEQCEIQRVLAESLSTIENVEADIDTNLQKAEALRQAILKKAFAGELVPQDPADEPAAALLARRRAERATATSTKPARRTKAPCPAA